MIQWGRALAAAGLLLVAQTATAQDAPTPAPDWLGANIVNGIPTNLQPTTGALLFVGPDTKNQFLDCSGVLIGCRTVLTAAHCLCKASPNYADCLAKLPLLPDIDTSDLRFFFQHSGIHHVREVFIDPQYIEGTGHDIAILRLSELVTGIEPAKVHQSFLQPVEHDMDAVIAGFGNSGDDRLDEGIKRVGQVTTAECPPSTGVYEPANICWNFTAPILKPGDEANLCLHDDGGPMFIDFGNGPEVAGIHGGGGETCGADTFSYDTNVLRSRDWIRTTGGLDITRDQCSDTIGEVGEPWVEVQGGAGTLAKDEAEERFSFDILEESQLVRVVVNGDTEKDGDFNMFVGLDNHVPTADSYDCAAKGVGQFGACSFDEPGAQRVNVLIQRIRPTIGDARSRFQLTVTTWQAIPPHEDPPRGPDNLRYTKRAENLRTLTWIDDSNNETGFELQRRPGTSPTATFTRRALIKKDMQSYLETVLDTNVFTYRIRAYNLFGFSEWSNLCVVNLPRLPRPTRLRAPEITNKAVTLKWRDNSSGESYMEVQRRVSGTLKWKTIKLLPENTIDYVDKTVQSGQNYEYRVRARGFLDECIKHSAFSPRLEVTVPLQ